jgi:hypothetical protein
MLLVILNILVWSAVFAGYWQEWKNGEFPDYKIGPTDFASAGCIGGVRDGQAWGKVCVGELCRWGFIDCAEVAALDYGV